MLQAGHTQADAADDAHSPHHDECPQPRHVGYAVRCDEPHRRRQHQGDREGRREKEQVEQCRTQHGHPAWPVRVGGVSRIGSTALSPAAVARNLMYSSATSRSGKAVRSDRSGGAAGSGYSVTSGNARASSASARGMWYAEVTTSSEWIPLSRAQAAVSAALPRVVVALRSSMTRAASGRGSTPARRASSASSAPPPMPDSNKR